MNEKDAKLLMDTILTAAILGNANKKAEEEKKEEKTPNYREEAHNIGKILFATYLGLQDAGFTPEQAFELTLAMKD
jgi:hypothetical protein